MIFNLLILGASFMIMLYLINTIYMIYSLKYSISSRRIKVEYLSILYDFYEAFTEQYFYHKQQGYIIADYDDMSDLLLTRISDTLDGDINTFRKEYKKRIGKELTITKNGIVEPKIEKKKDLTYDTFLKATGGITSKQMDDILDEINRRKKNKKKKKNNGKDITK